VCSCETVTKGQICGAVEAGCTTAGDVKAATRAGAGCGGCTAMVTDIVNARLEAAGVTVDRSLCEHFPYTRQELFDLVRVQSIEGGEQARKGSTIILTIV
jgi:nitrite reductase (NADH) large subunit